MFLWLKEFLPESILISSASGFRLRPRELFVSAVKEIAAVQCKKGGFGSSHNDEKKFMLLMRCALTPLPDPEEHTFVQAALCGAVGPPQIWLGILFLKESTL